MPSYHKHTQTFVSSLLNKTFKLKKRKGTLATVNITNLVEASTNQATEILLGGLLVQAEEIQELKALIEQNAAVPGNGIPSLVNTDTLSVMSSQFQAMKVKLDSLKATIAAAATTAAATVAAKKTDIKKKKQNAPLFLQGSEYRVCRCLYFGSKNTMTYF